MKLILTEHAKKRMFERNISINDIHLVLDFPDYTLVKEDKFESYKKINSETIKIVYTQKGNFIKIITLIRI